MKLDNFENRQFIEQIWLDRENVQNFNIYPFNVPSVKNMKTIKFEKPVTFFVGENGTGKSTFIEAIAVCCGLNAEGGSKNFMFNTYESHSELHKYMKISRSYKKPDDYYFLRAESFYNVATNIEMLDSETGGPSIKSYYGGSLHEKSHGESFFALLKNRLTANGLYVFDEPEAALSPIRQMSMLAIIDNLVKAGSQFIIATHSPIIMAYPNADIYQFDEKSVEKVNYEDVEGYILTRQFLNNRERYLKLLLEDEV